MRDNIITVNYKNSHYSVSSTILWQWDYGQILKLVGFDLPENYIVHFANDPLAGDALVQIGDEDGVDIPDELLETGKPIYAWLYQHTSNTDGETVYMITINVKPRPKPTDGDATPEQINAVDRAIAALNGAVTTATSASEAAILAKNSAEAAANEADRIITNVVRFDVEQTLTQQQQLIVQNNMGLGSVLEDVNALNAQIFGEIVFKVSTEELAEGNTGDTYLPKDVSYVGKTFGTDMFGYIQNTTLWINDPETGLPIQPDTVGEYFIADIDLSAEGIAFVSFPVLSPSATPVTALFMNSNNTVVQQYNNISLNEGDIATVELVPGVVSMKFTISRLHTMSHDLYVIAQKDPLLELDDVLRYGQQTLTESQKEQVRENIGTDSKRYIVHFLKSYDATITSYTYTADKTVKEIFNAAVDGKEVWATVDEGSPQYQADLYPLEFYWYYNFMSKFTTIVRFSRTYMANNGVVKVESLTGELQENYQGTILQDDTWTMREAQLATV